MTPQPPIEERRARRRTPPVLAAVLLLLCLGSSAWAAAGGPLDRSFGEGGVVLAPDPPGAAALALAADGGGRLLAGGTNVGGQFVLRRFKADGSPDSGFGEGGLVETQLGVETAVQALAVAPDGTILAAGGTETAFGLVRYQRTGAVDRAFGRRGQVLTPVGSEGAGVLGIGLQSNGRILLAGYGRDLARNWTAIVAAYRPNGAIDRSFGRRGMFRIAAGHGTAVAFSGIRVLPDDRVLLGGDRNGRPILVRLRADGRPDTSFGGGDGRVSVDADRGAGCACSFATSLAVAPGGRPLLAGILTGPGAEASFLARFTPGGRLDRGFGGDGVVRTLKGRRLISNDAAVAGDGRVVTVGSYVPVDGGPAQLAVVRYLPSGALDRGFGRSGLFAPGVGRESVGHALLARPDGRVVVAGRANLGGPSGAEGASALDGAQFLLMRLRATGP